MPVQSRVLCTRHLFYSFCILVMVFSQSACTRQRTDVLLCDADVTVSETMKKLCSPGGGRQGFLMVGYLGLRQSEGDNRAYLRFELNGIDPAGITGAELRLWKSRSRQDTLRVFAVTVDGWDEYGTSWGNGPAMGELVASGHCGQGWNAYDVTEYVKKQTDDRVSFGLRVLNQDQPGLGFNSREGGNPPRLVVTHSGPPAGDTPPNPGFPSTSKLEHGVYISDGSSLSSYNDIKSAVAAVKPGQEIVLGPGIYYETFDLSPDGTADKPLKIRGDGDPRPIIDGTLNQTAWAKGDHGRVDRGLVRVSGDFWTLEHLEIRNAHPWGESPQQNTAGIFILDGTGVTVSDCGVYFGSNGIFATSTTENLTLEYNEVAYNSFPGRGYKHGHYISGPGITTVRFNHIHHNGGTNFKSRSEHLVFYCNYVHSAGSYHLDLSAGRWEDQDAVLAGNLIVTDNEHRANPQFIVFGENRHGGSLHLYNNTFINLYPDGYAFVNMWFPGDAKLLSTTLEACNNVFHHRAYWGGEKLYRSERNVPVLGSNNWVTTGTEAVPETLKNTIFGEELEVIDLIGGDFRPSASSRLIDSATLKVPELPGHEYLHPCMKKVREIRGKKIDIGAFEAASE